MDNKTFWRTFSVRSAFIFFLTTLIFLLCILRVAVISADDYTQVAIKQSRYKLNAGKVRGTIFDCNLVPLTNNQKKIIAAVSPTPRAITAISSVLDGEELKTALEQLKKGKPVLCEVEKEIVCDGIICKTVNTTDYETLVAKHILGYTNADGNGVSGLEAAFDDLLFSGGEITFCFESTGVGNILAGVEPIVETTNTNKGNLISTIDINIQNLAEEYANYLKTGAIVVADVKTNKIRALVSRPDFDVNNISAFLEESDSPLLNRAISTFSVGSVFKPCVAAAGLEKGNRDFTYICTGSCEIIDRYFKCHKKDGHGLTDLRLGLAHSCNTFFYNFSFKIGGNKIYETAKKFKFGSSLSLCDGIKTTKGNLPNSETLNNIAHLANFSIGQGELLLSPVSMLTLYSAIATDGKYYTPSVVEGILDNKGVTKYNIGNPTKAISPETAKILREYLTSVLKEGTGQDATPETVTAAGKTATAQTGKYQNGREIHASWFCGFFPAEEPKYTVIVFSENSLNQTMSCAKIFANIADGITSLG